MRLVNGRRKAFTKNYITYIYQKFAWKRMQAPRLAFLRRAS
jgi:hypothetical protein